MTMPVTVPAAAAVEPAGAVGIGTSRMRVALNSAAGTGAQLAAILVSLVTTPLILRALGATDYGAFAVLGSLTSYFGLLDLGIAGSMTRFITVYEERGQGGRAAALVAFGGLFYLGLGLLVLPVLLVAAPALGRFLEMPPDVQARMPVLLAAVLALFLGWALSGILGARLTALHRMHAAAAAAVAGSLAFLLLVAVVLPRHPTIGAVFACTGAQLVVTIAVLVVMNRRAGGPVLAWPTRLSRAEMRELFSFSAWQQLSSLTAVVNLEADKVIISRGIGVASVTPYHVANRLAVMARTLPSQLLSSLLPALTARITRGVTPAELHDLYAGASRALMIPTLVVAGFVGGAADALLRLWLDQRLPGAAGLCAALLASACVNMLTGAGTSVLRARGRPRLETGYGAAAAALNIAFTVALIGPLGLRGVVLGTVIGNVLGSAMFLVLFHRQERLPWWSTVGGWLARLTGVTLASAAAAHLFLRVFAHDAGRLELVPLLAAAGLGYLALFAGLGQAAGLWTADDRAMVRRLAGRLRRRRQPA